MTRTNWITWLGALGAVALLGASQAGCNEPTCGTGTIDQNGSCVPATDMVGSASCGAGTHLGTDGLCDPDFKPTQCDPDTTDPVIDPTTGVITCKGTGGGGCGAPITCGTPSTGRMSICGQLFNIEDNTPIQKVGATGTPCDPANPEATGPCSLAIQAYDAIGFVGNPTGATPLPSDEVLINDCGQFRIKNINIGTSVQYVGVGLDDNPKATDNHRLTGVALPIASGKAITSFPVYAVANAVDTKWSNDAGLTGSTFVDRGVYMGLFLHAGAPVSGVKITISGGTSPANSFYFKDTTPASRMTIDPAQLATGVDGAGLMIGNNNLLMYSGMGGEPNSCKWPSDLGDQIPGVAFIQPRVAVQTANPTMTCP
jgi:hypothetical protein